jgi:hypothetical protein
MTCQQWVLSGLKYKSDSIAMAICIWFTKVFGLKTILRNDAYLRTGGLINASLEMRYDDCSIVYFFIADLSQNRRRSS